MSLSLPLDGLSTAHYLWILDSWILKRSQRGETVELVVKHRSPGIGAKRNLATRSSTAEVCNPVGSGVPIFGFFFFGTIGFSQKMASYLWNEISSFSYVIVIHIYIYCYYLLRYFPENFDSKDLKTRGFQTEYFWILGSLIFQVESTVQSKVFRMEQMITTFHNHENVIIVSWKRNRGFIQAEDLSFIMHLLKHLSFQSG